VIPARTVEAVKVKKITWQRAKRFLFSGAN